MLQGTKKVIAKHNFCNKNMLIKIKERMQGFQKLACTYIICTGKSLSEALILGSTNPQYRVFQLDMTYFEVQDGQLKLTSKFKKR